MPIRIIVVDRTRSPFLRKGETFYMERLARYTRLEWVEVKPERIAKGRKEREILAKEGRSIVKRVGPRDHVIALEMSGKVYDSEEFSEKLGGLVQSGAPVAFIVGGPLGLSEEVLNRARETLSLSRLTFTHEMARLILLEQLYRAFTIMRNEKYHK
ncbi:MAG: 23S rRNA (pseudouridine(1915)-N(3))-methyltransferase RlmH [Deltaproteobacteria bacterium]|nr:23S rRNA (pseudouridine(1915)-N(3))-methyltransferase RlmH [Deltaproteobacteria bacterium]MBW1818282.1 23S rRNA (pseudouridine(1915)-N(3))-methyltransferase RlmH [Deltaproteobacteria bacterium]MBW2285368.1 23S rRNA (pseudouridine(1915)-N(3))-methyltransferase RlmH [Deltaproteobacteria bacterium]